MPDATIPSAPAAGAAPVLQDRVLAIVRELAGEVGGPRAQRAVAPHASLERDVGLGSLERVELVMRLERAFGRTLDERFLAIETPAALATALGGVGAQDPSARASRAPSALPSGAVSFSGAATLHEALWRRAEVEPDRPHVHMREESEEERTFTYSHLLADARSIAGGLRERGIRKGDRVVLVLPTGLDFLSSFQGILMAGAIPVPIYPPARLDRLEEYALRQSVILADSGARALITIPRALPIAELLRPPLAGAVHVTTAEALRGLGATSAALEGEGGDPALIQYTSGSTGEPKGVLLSHDNLLANIRAIHVALAVQPTDIGVSWLPLYHDMGLIGSWLFCLYHGLPISILSPLAFLARPERWLWTIHERRATLSAAPNFAYDLCVRRISEAALEGLDLSSWRCALNGAEPVNPDTLERFAARFAPYRFRREALLPVHGLAENSVALCFPPPGRGPRVDRVQRGLFERESCAQPADASEASPLRFVSVGTAVPGHEVRIVDDRGHHVPERSVGRLVFRGPSATEGYFNKPASTAAMMLPDGWLDSGDLAYAADGEVYIAGRRKDLIIKAGRNLVPQEIEQVVSSVKGVREGSAVAFGVAHEAQGSESIVVVAETRVVQSDAKDRLVAAINDRVSAALGIPPDVVCLAAPGSIPRTSSGKLRRSATKDLYVRGQLGERPRTTLVHGLKLAAAAGWRAARAPLRFAVRLGYAVYLAAAFALTALPLWILVAVFPSRRLALRLGRLTARAVLRLGGCRLEVEGLEHLRAGGPLVLASNHASYVDAPVLMALLPFDFLFVAKKDVLGYPVVGTYVRRSGHFAVDRSDVQDSVASSAGVTRALEDGARVLFFPEATFTAAAGLRPFRLGAFKAAVETGTPVVPLSLQGTRRVLRGETWLPRPGRIRLWVGAPIAPEGGSWRAIVALRDRVADAIAAHCGEPRLDLVAAGPERP